MSATTATILPWIQLLAGGGSGVVASWFFNWLRTQLPQAAVRPWLATALYAPRYARLFVLILAALIAVLASVLVALLTAGDMPAAFDAAAAAAISGIASQLVHAKELPPEPPPTTLGGPRV